MFPKRRTEVLLVLDGSTGQNALEQARQFTAATDVTTMAVTKLDGTAKGGVVLALPISLKFPVRFIGVGEKMEDLLVFDKHEFVDSLFNLKRRIIVEINYFLMSNAKKKILKILDDIKKLLTVLFQSKKKDKLIGPVFDERIADRWPSHLEKMYIFGKLFCWTSVLMEVLFRRMPV